MEIPIREVGIISAKGKMSTRIIDKEIWNGCPCVWPGGGHCDCRVDCPCKKTTISNTLPNAWATPFGE